MAFGLLLDEHARRPKTVPSIGSVCDPLIVNGTQRDYADRAVVWSGKKMLRPGLDACAAPAA